MDLVRSVVEKFSTVYQKIPNKVAEGTTKLNQAISEVAHGKLAVQPTTPRALRTAATVEADKDGFVLFPSLIEPPSQEVCDSDEEKETELDGLIEQYKALFSPKADPDLEVDSDLEENEEVHV